MNEVSLILDFTAIVLTLLYVGKLLLEPSWLGGGTPIPLARVPITASGVIMPSRVRHWKLNRKNHRSDVSSRQERVSRGAALSTDDRRVRSSELRFHLVEGSSSLGKRSLAHQHINHRRRLAA